MEGNSDELDEPIKTVFADVAFVKKHNLMSLNSINWSRVLVQIAHHFFAYFQCAPSLDMHPLPPVEVVVPTGAAGNLAGEETPGQKWAFQKNACGPCPPSPTSAITRVGSFVVSSLSHVQLFATPRTVAHQAPLSMGFPRQEYWSGLPFPSPGDLLDPGIEPRSPTLGGGFFITEPPRKPRLGPR